jgi:hypothetical protein
MPDQNFNNKELKKLKTNDDLEQYVRLTTPGVWIVLSAAAALLIGLIIWAFFGTAATTVVTRAATVDGKMQCFLPENEYQLVRVGDPAYINDMPWTVTECSSVPLSRDMAYGIIGSDYLYYELVDSNKSYQVTLEPVQSDPADGQDREDDVATVNVVIHTRSVHPIDLILDQ